MPGTAHQAMLAVGVVEVVAGIAVAVAPRYGALLVAAWLAGIVVNLVTLGDYYDVALRDVGLLAGALALAALAFDRARGHGVTRSVTLAAGPGDRPHGCGGGSRTGGRRSTPGRRSGRPPTCSPPWGWT